MLSGHEWKQAHPQILPCMMHLDSRGLCRKDLKLSATLEQSTPHTYTFANLLL